MTILSVSSIPSKSGLKRISFKISYCSFLLIVLIFTSYCKDADVDNRVGVKNIGSVKSDNRHVIFTAEETAFQARERKHFFKIDPPFWTPTNDDVENIEKAVDQYFVSAKGGDNRVDILRKNRDKYVHQYFGYTYSGRKKVLRNSYCNDPQLEERYRNQKVPIIIIDGETCFYRMKYDTELGKVISIEINY
jgi:hypothetical protein